MEINFFPVYRFLDPKKNEKYLLVFNKDRTEVGNDLEGLEMKLVGVGCKDDVNTTAFPNTRDIPRLAIVSDKLISFKSVVAAVEVFVVLEDVVKRNYFVAYSDMSLPLFMINEEDCLSFPCCHL